VKPSHPTALEYAKRTCAICGCHNPPFGFAPPVSDALVWACAADRLALTERLAAMLYQRNARPTITMTTPVMPRTAPRRGRKSTNPGEQDGLFL
jgi:hypothetical protein